MYCRIRVAFELHAVRIGLSFLYIGWKTIFIEGDGAVITNKTAKSRILGHTLWGHCALCNAVKSQG